MSFDIMISHAEKMKNVRQLLSDRQYERANELLDELVSQPESRAEALGIRAHHHQVFGRHEQALADLEQLRTFYQRSPELEVRISEAQFGCGDFESAIRSAARALEFDPALPLAAEIINRAMPLLCPSAGERVEPARESLNPVLDKIEQLTLSYSRGSVSADLGRFLYTLVRLLRPSVLVETGTFLGYSAICIGQALKDNAHGHLHTFDVFAGEHYSNVFGGQLSGGEIEQKIKSHLHLAGLEKWVSLHAGDSPAEIEKLFSELTDRPDFAFIDGDHRISGCMADWAAIEPLLEPAGIVLLHDTDIEASGWLGPRYLIEKLREQAPQKFSLVNCHTGDQFGLAMIQKLGSEGAGPWRPRFSELLFEKLANRRNLPGTAG
jgi:predicted O-methyltransferase YrrM